MPFTDLDEHLAEAFGEYVAEVAHGFLRDSVTDRAKRTTEGYFRKVQAKRKRHYAKDKVRRRVALLEDFMSGRRPHRCQRSGCCNLLVPKPGSVVRTCSRVCRTLLSRSRR